MNARNSTLAELNFALTSLAICGAFAILAASCANGDTGTGGNGGTNSSGGGPSSGGSSGTGSGGSTGGGDTVTFADGRAQGPMTGYAFLSLGPSDSASSPVCAEDPNNPTNTRPIAGPAVGKCDEPGKTCPTTGMTVWNAKDTLCISGSIPVVTPDTAYPSGDYKINWGLQIGVNTSDPPADNSGNGKTLQASYSTVTLTVNPKAVTPTNPAIRAFVHLVTQLCTDNPYCATIQESGPPFAPLTLTDFNTECWAGKKCAAGSTTCFQLKPEDVPNIDKAGVQISSDITNLYTVDNFCLQQIAFAK